MVKNIIIVVSLITVAVSLLILRNNLAQSNKEKSIIINNQKIIVEIADTEELRAKGLSGRISLESNHGMLFVFPKAQVHTFWMKGMQFPLDFVWIKDDLVADMTENVLNPSDPTIDPSNFYSPSIPVNKVLEINSGDIQKLNIKIGDRIIIK